MTEYPDRRKTTPETFTQMRIQDPDKKYFIIDIQIDRINLHTKVIMNILRNDIGDIKATVEENLE